MSSSRSGVQVHCRSHVLNLAILSGCKALQSIQNLFYIGSRRTWFLSGSSKRKEIFLQTAEATDDSELLSTVVACADWQTVPKFCATRWSAKVTTLSALLAKYGSVLLTLDEILSSSSGDAKHDASAHSHLLQDSEFIVAIVDSISVCSAIFSPSNKVPTSQEL